MFDQKGEVVVSWGDNQLEIPLSTAAKKSAAVLGTSVLITILICTIVLGSGVLGLIMSLILVGAIFGMAGYFGKDQILSFLTKGAVKVSKESKAEAQSPDDGPQDANTSDNSRFESTEAAPESSTPRDESATAKEAEGKDSNPPKEKIKGNCPTIPG